MAVPAVLQWLLVTPIQRPSIDGGALITGVQFLTNPIVDPIALTASAMIGAIEDGGPGSPSRRIVTVPITGPMTMNQLLAAFKATTTAIVGPLQ